VLVKPSSDPADVFRGREAGAADFWGTCTSLADSLSRVHSLLRLKSYIDEQAKSVVLSLARSIEAKRPLMDGHSERMANYAEQLGGVWICRRMTYKNCGSRACFTMSEK